MRPFTSDQVRDAFLEFFEEHGHQRVPSSSLIPYNDDTILLTNAGMVQFKDVFLGFETRPYLRAATAQKCVRGSGKHNDLENVGPSPRHHTFFEMLGNFSFGDYFKRDAIRFAYDFLTGVLGLDPARLYYTVFQDDDDAFGYWTQDMGIDPARVYRMGEKTNFWSMGDVGPCGPTSEVHFDWGPQACTCGRPDCSVLIDNGCDRWLEIWNLVFMQYNQDANGVRTPLPRPGIDTGMGLERIVGVVQGTPVNYETDLFTPILDHIQALLGHTTDQRQHYQTAYRVIADHARAAAFLIADGVRPGPAGAPYVLRTVIRRAFRFGRTMGLTSPFLAQVGEAVIARMGSIYPELNDRAALIRRTVTREEEQFIAALDRAQSELDRILAELSAQGISELPGDSAFDLKSTYGLPLPITRDICNERGFTIEEAGFQAAEEAHRRTSQGKIGEIQFAAGAEHYARALGKLQQRGLLPEGGIDYDPYGALTCTTQVIGILSQGELVESAGAGEEVDLILAETPFYVAAGGQVSDTGRIIAAGWEARVTDMARPVSALPVHRATIVAGSPRIGDSAEAVVDAGRRWDIMRNHTATHLLHEALRTHLGRDVHQAGSLVAPDRLRFDFSYDAPITIDQLDHISETVNQAILAGYPLKIEHKGYKQALAEGATALFTEKYGDIVRTVFLGDCIERVETGGHDFCSRELCGGTHVHNTAQIGSFVIVSEGASAAGVRRIEALTGAGAEHFARQHLGILNRLSHSLSAPVVSLEARLQDLRDQVSDMARELQRLRQQAIVHQAEELARKAQKVGSITVLATTVEVADMNGMRLMADDLRNKLGSGVVVLGAVFDGRPAVLAAATPDVVASGVNANAIVKAIGPVIGGSGGGRPDMAQAGGRDPSRLADALAAAVETVRPHA
ncbi:MAG: alanine--tRNA ligase [Caldilineales bacterium]|nr:alanine--tRNA ligase [Caldilineales bacterium]